MDRVDHCLIALRRVLRATELFNRDLAQSVGLTAAQFRVLQIVAEQDHCTATEIAGRVRVHGRGGTVLQPGIDLLQRADDFPPAAPVLVITDGWCDVLRVRREHAYLIPQGARLPFTARGPVFRVS